MLKLVLIPLAERHLELLSQENWSQKEFLFWTGPRFSYPMIQDEFIDHCNDSSRMWWVLKKGLEVLGVGELQKIGDQKVKLSRIYVFKAYRGKGYGKILIHLLMQKTKPIEGKLTFMLNVFEDNKIALNLYQQLGFKIEQEKQMMVGEEEFTLLTMSNL